MEISSLIGSTDVTSTGLKMDRYEIEEKLAGLGIPEDIIEQGPDAVKKYADENNIDISKIQPPEKQESKPSPKVKGAGDSVKKDFETKLEALGIPKETIEKGKEAVAAYAKEHNIKLPEPPSGSKLNFRS